MQLLLSFLLLVGLLLCNAKPIPDDLSPTAFTEEVLKGDKVWIVEFYSKMCGSCKEFSPTWKKVVENVKSSVMTTQINIDLREGAGIAEEVGALQEGIPNVRIFHHKDGKKGKSLYTGEGTMSETALIKKIMAEVKDLTRDSNGSYLKKSEILGILLGLSFFSVL